jgi:cellulose synthase operon protein C
VTALQRAAELDVRHADLFDRLRTLLAARGDTEGLSALMKRRLDAGGDPKAMVGLHLARADLCEQLGDPDGARHALRAALEIEANGVEALRRLAKLCMDMQDWREATEALIRVARLRQDRDELRWVFFQLGEIYQHHMPDPQRAEQAFRRVLKINPHDAEGLGRLAGLLREQNRLPEAVEVLRELCNRDPAPDRRRDHRLLLAEVLEQHGDLRGAEAELEQASRGRPSDLVVLRAVAEFYQRQNAESALGVHLGRAVADLRQVLTNDPLDEPAWRGLVEVQRWRGHKDASRCCASVAAAFGVLDIELARLLDPKGGVPGAGPQAITAEVEERLAPSALSPAVRRIFELASDAFEKVLPFDPKAARVERVGRDSPLRREVQEAVRLTGLGDVQVLVSDAHPRACIPVQSSPATVIMGRDLWSASDAGERLFLLVRAIRIAHAQLAFAVRVDPAQMALLMGSLIHAYDPSHLPAEADAEQVAELARRLKKAVPRRSRDELGPLLLEARGSSTNDVTKLADAALTFGNRFALVALGSFPAALSALFKAAHDQAPGADRPQERAALLRRTPEAWALFSFALSDAHFAARKQAGLGGR